MRTGSIILAIIITLTARTLKAADSLSCTEYDDYILTHQLTPFGPVPTALDPNGVYPYVSYCETSNRPALKKYHFIVLQNDDIKITVCPDLGGKIFSMIHKPSGKEVLYVPGIIRQTRILPRFYFVAGGIEVSFPISHTPVQNEKLLYRIDRTPDRIYVTCGERELRFGMQWSVEYSLGMNDPFLTERVVFRNPGSLAYPWMSWSNAAIPAAPDTRFDFPKGRVLSHASTVDTIDWEKQGPRTQSDIKEMTGYFGVQRRQCIRGIHKDTWHRLISYRRCAYYRRDKIVELWGRRGQRMVCPEYGKSPNLSRITGRALERPVGQGGTSAKRNKMAFRILDPFRPSPGHLLAKATQHAIETRYVHPAF